MKQLDAERQMRRRKRKNTIFHALFLSSTLFGVIALGMLLIQILSDGLGWLNWEFLTNNASRKAEKSGIKAAIAGTLWMMSITAPLSFIIGVSTAIYLEEYAKKNWFNRFIQTNIANLAGVPSIVYGLLGLTIFVRVFGFGKSVLAGSLTMTLLILPIIIVASQEAIKAIPVTQRNASFALGANRWQTIIRVVLPSALPGIMTGSILSFSRAVGETAPLIVVGAVAYITTLPSGVFDKFTVMPIQIYTWANLPQEEFHHVAAAGIIVLLFMLLSMNAIAIFLRNKYQKKN
ncbi:phosphate ABC transporter permease PstA [Chengkuizengella marina]|uniref:Phosphate transport system permease protein PstA n=1 Tax=Chengkuizengella marina TaxID=2507566 RepID=A0A6N9PXR0_9BACL|nr:phosphate ABC transporter permease PstA [Chengkuizengella marina]NBI28299.1 phosphate ABC transporter permease PstA [Chengkuizengella marina]